MSLGHGSDGQSHLSYKKRSQRAAECQVQAVCGIVRMRFGSGDAEEQRVGGSGSPPGSRVRTAKGPRGGGSGWTQEGG